MRTYFRYSLFTVLFLANSSIVLGAEVGVQVIDRIVAVIDGEPVTSTEFGRFLKLTGKSPEKSGIDTKKLLEDFVQSRLIELEAEKSGIEVNEEQITNYIEQIKSQNSVDDSGLEQMLRQQGMSLRQYKAQVRFDIIQARLLASKVRNKISIVDEDVERYLVEHPELVPKVGQVKLEQYSILLETPQLSDEVARLIEQIRAEVKDGKKINTGGGIRVRDIGYVDLANLKKAYADAVESSADGVLSDVVYETKAAHFFRIVHRQDAEGAVDEQTKSAIVERLTEKEFRKATEAYFLEKLPESYNVEYKL